MKKHWTQYIMVISEHFSYGVTVCLFQSAHRTAERKKKTFFFVYTKANKNKREWERDRRMYIYISNWRSTAFQISSKKEKIRKSSAKLTLFFQFLFSACVFILVFFRKKKIARPFSFKLLTIKWNIINLCLVVNCLFFFLTVQLYQTSHLFILGNSSVYYDPIFFPFG